MIHINTSALAFYDRLDRQSHRLDYAYNGVYSLICSTIKLLPFQVIVDKTFPTVTALAVMTKDGAQVQTLAASTILRKTFTDYDVLMYIGTNTLTQELDEGLYYLELRAGATILYSEVFNAVKTVQASEVLGITYWDNEDFVFQHTAGRLVYSDNYRNKLYLPTKLAKPDYKIEEVVEDRDGFKFVEKQIQKKLFRFSFLATEYICDVVALIGMHDNIVITYNNKIYIVYDILFTPTWTADGFLANVDAEFTTDAVIKKIGRLFPKHNLGDFNSDFNSDFNVI
jgi:hypothetical protein